MQELEVQKFSTHDLVRGRISFRNFKCKVPRYFNSRSRERSTPAADESVQMPKLFQLTTSQGEVDVLIVRDEIGLLLFNSRPHEKVDIIGLEVFLIILFQLARRSTTILSVLAQCEEDFNSRPHEEVDLKMISYKLVIVEFQLTTS